MNRKMIDSFLSASNELWLTIDAQFIITTAYGPWKKLLKVEASDVIGKPFEIFVKKEDSHFVLNALNRTKETGVPEQMKITWCYKVNHCTPFELTIQWAENEWLVKAFHLKHFATQAHHQEAFSYSDERLFQALLQESDDALIFVDENKVIRYFNEKADRSALFFNNRRIEKGQPVLQYIDAQELSAFTEHLELAMSGNLVSSKKEFRVDNQTHVLNFTFQPVSPDSGINGVFIAIKNQTEQELLNEAHQQAEQALIDSERKYKMLVENAFDAIYLIRNRNFEYCNQRFLDLTGYKSNEVVSQTFDFADLLSEKSQAIVEARYEARKRGEELPSQYEFQIKRKDGGLVDVEISTVSLSEGDQVVVLGIMRDISERIAAREALRNERAYFKHLIESLPFGVVVLSTDDSVLDCNPYFLDMFKLEKANVINHKINDLIVPKKLKDEGNELTGLVAGGGEINHETIRQRTDGKLLNVAIKARPTKLPDGSSIVFGTYQDISDRKKAEEALQYERDLMDALMNNIPDTIYFKDTKSRFIRINKAQCRALGVAKAEDAYGKTDLDFFDTEHAKKTSEEEQVIMQQSKPLINSVEHIETAKGWRWYSATKVPIKNKKGIAIGLAGISRDITELKTMEETLRQNELRLKNINAEKDKLFSIIAHDLRSPFNSFLMLTEMFLDDTFGLTVDEIKKLAVSMHKSAANLSDLLDNLLNWSRLQRGLIDFEKVDVRLDEVAATIVDSVDEMIRSKDLVIQNDIPVGFIVKADPGMIASMLRNTLTNAVKFTPKGGVVNLQAWYSDDHKAHIKVNDSGIGMPPRIKENLFTIDGKVGRKGTEGEPTAGLGLILVKEFVDKHKGSIQISSVENEGTEFEIILPN